MIALGHRLARLGWAFFQLTVGLALGLLMLEAVLQLNAGLLLRGMAAPNPIEDLLTVRSYLVRLSDADLFFWHGDLIRPIASLDDEVEAEVEFGTDEFGFPNTAPVSALTDLVVLGRSFSVGAQAARPWPQLLSSATGLSITNLSQAASGIGAKRTYLRRFGLARHPRWIILEVLPSMDIIGYGREEPLLVPQLPLPLVQTFARRWLPSVVTAANETSIYPLHVALGRGHADLVFFSYYLAALTVDEAELAASRQWAQYQAQVRLLVADAEANGACVLMLYAPTKEEIYFPLAADAEELTPVLRAGWPAWELGPDNSLTQNTLVAPRVREMQTQASAARKLLRAFAATQALQLIDPTDAMQAAALAGDAPFMRYDSHWSAYGHALVAELSAETLAEASCP